MKIFECRKPAKTAQVESTAGMPEALESNPIGQVEGCPKRAKSLEWGFRNPFSLVIQP